MKRFENKTILITGASSGIGLAGAKRLIEEGKSCAGCSSRVGRSCYRRSG